MTTLFVTVTPAADRTMLAYRVRRGWDGSSSPTQYCPATPAAWAYLIEMLLPRYGIEALRISVASPDRI